MSKTAADVIKTIKDKEVKFLDLRFTDTKGKMQHVTADASCVDDAMFADGYAFDGAVLQTAPADGVWQWQIVGTALAGQPWPTPLAAGQALRIMTGAVMPPGADTVVPQELCAREGDTLRLDERFRFPEGERLQRWHLRFAGARVEGTVETEGRDGTLRAAVPAEGERSATGVELRYVGYAPGGRALPLSFRHRMVANADGTLQNHVTVRLLGLPLARSEVTFAKSERDLKRHLATAPHP